MKNFKLRSLIIMTALILCAVMVLGSCGAESGEAVYKVSVADANGNAYASGIVVKFMQNGEQIAMQACDENGVAEKTLAKGEYQIELNFTDGAENYHYDGELALSAENTELNVTLARKVTSDPVALFADGTEHEAYSIDAGCTYVELEAEKRSYFLFSPTQAGTYEISVTDDSNTQIGYYGAPHFVQSQSIAEVSDNKFEISVSASMIGTGDSGTSTYVIGVDSLDADTKACVVGIERTGDPKKTIEDEPWTIYEATSEMVEYTLPEGAEIKEFDLTADSDAYTIVYNEDDGFYHLDTKDGPLVLVRLAEDCDYIACFATMLDRSGVSAYYYDEDGNFEKKVSFSECLLEYIKYVDEEEGVYPLNEDLKHIITERGEYVGWWDAESPSYIFKDVDGNNLSDINTEIAWLLMCCYID